MSNIGNGNRGRFSDRLKRMRINRLNKNKVKKSDAVQLPDSEIIYKNFMKVVAVIPIMVVENIFEKDTDSKRETNKNSTVSVTTNRQLDEDQAILLDAEQRRIISNQKKKINRERINAIDVSLIKKKQDEYLKRANIIARDALKDTKDIMNFEDKETLHSDANFDKNTRAKELEKKIINLIKKDLIKTVNELEVLESELYILSEVNGEEKTLSECRKTIDEVKKILCKIDKLKEKYDYLKDNYDFEYLLETDDNELIDSIIELKTLFDKNEAIATAEDYKLLDVYKYLYLRIDQIHDDTVKFEDEKKKKELELKDRDINFKKLKESVYDIDKMNDSYNFFVYQQNEFLKDLENKISKINSYESVDYKLKGFSRYLFNSFKYLGLLMMNPLRGVLPSIATQTLITRNVVKNLRKNLKWEETRKMVYDAIDYSGSIGSAINDLDSTDRMVDATLDDLIKLKMEYNDRFKKYQGDFLEYRDVIWKINDMENKILGNKIKIEIMKNRMKEYQRENEHKLVLVRKLNETAPITKE